MGTTNSSPMNNKYVETCGNCINCDVDCRSANNHMVKVKISCKLNGFEPCESMLRDYNSMTKSEIVASYITSIPNTCPYRMSCGSSARLAKILDDIRDVIESYTSDDDLYIIDNIMYDIGVILKSTTLS